MLNNKKRSNVEKFSSVPNLYSKKSNTSKSNSGGSSSSEKLFGYSSLKEAIDRNKSFKITLYKRCSMSFLLEEHRLNMTSEDPKIQISVKLNIEKLINDHKKSVSGKDMFPFLVEKIFIPFGKQILDELVSYKGIAVPSHSIKIDGLSKESFLDAFKLVKNKWDGVADEFKTFQLLISKAPYNELFPCRKIVRHIHVVEAPTNSGKTYDACTEIEACHKENPNSDYACFFPLRALAAQEKDGFIERGVNCNLVTGEEQEVMDGARITCATTETCDTSKKYKKVFIDEAHLLFDKDRQSGYANAILGAYCDKLILAVSPAYKDALIALLERFTDDEITVSKKERLCKLEVSEPVDIKKVEKGDLVVAFSARSVHLIAESLNKAGFKTGVIYGRMSPSSRRKMISEFKGRDLDCLVATDAIGMGLSIPVKRVLFAEGEKYDGDSVKPLSKEQIRQIAGRAGRFGYYPVGYASIYTSWSEGNKNLKVTDIKDALSAFELFQTPECIFVGPNKQVIKSAKTLSIAQSLQAWKMSVESHPGIKACPNTYAELMTKAEFLDQFAGHDRSNLVELLYTTYYQEKSDQVEEWYFDTLRKLINSKSVGMPDPEGSDIETLELKCSMLSTLSQLQRIYPYFCPDEASIAHEQEKHGDKLALLLLDRYTKGAKRTVR